MWSAMAYPLSGPIEIQDAYVEAKRHEFEQQMIAAYADNRMLPAPILHVTTRLGPRMVVVYDGCMNRLPL